MRCFRKEAPTVYRMTRRCSCSLSTRPSCSLDLGFLHQSRQKNTASAPSPFFSAFLDSPRRCFQAKRAVGDVGKGRVSDLRLRRAGNVNKPQVHNIWAVNQRIIAGEKCRTWSSGWRCWRSWRGNGWRLLEKLTCSKTLVQTPLGLFLSLFRHLVGLVLLPSEWR